MSGLLLYSVLRQKSLSISQESSDSEKITVEVGDEAIDSKRGGLRNPSCDELSIPETGVDMIPFWIGLESTDRFDCISVVVVHGLTGKAVSDKALDAFGCINECSQFLRKSIKLPDRMFVPNWFR